MCFVEYAHVITQIHGSASIHGRLKVSKSHVSTHVATIVEVMSSRPPQKSSYNCMSIVPVRMSKFHGPCSKVHEVMPRDVINEAMDGQKA